MHTPSTAFHRHRDELSCAFCEPGSDMPQTVQEPLLCSLRRGLRAPPHHRFPPTSPGEEGFPRPRDRRRSRAFLAAHPRRVADRRVGRHVAALPRGARRTPPRRRDARRHRPGREPGVGHRALQPPAAGRRRARARRRDRGPARRARRPRRADRGAGAGDPFAVDGGGRPVQPALHVRPVRHRRLQPARPRRRARGRRDAGARLQPAVHLRSARPRQDPPPALDRQLRRRLRRRADRPLHDGRGVHQPLHRRAP